MATLTITVSGTPATRIAHAVGRRFSLKDENGTARDATLLEVTEALRTVLRNWVAQSEEEEAAIAAAASAGTLTLT